jgi:hypothetical protein
MSHTAGPWKLLPYGDNECDVCGRDNSLVCILREGDTSPDDDWQSDANLISAAPDLLAACEELLIYLGDWDDMDNDTCAAARKAIAKAKGENSDASA